MPPKNNVELGSGQLYFKGLDEPLEIYDGEIEAETEYYDESKPYIKNVMEPVTLEFNNVEFARGWTLAECKECGYKFPVSKYYALLLGTKGWTCPRCVFNKTLEDAMKRREIL